MKRLPFILGVLILLPHCSVPTEEPAAKSAEPAPAPVADESRRFPMQDRVTVDIVADNLLGKDFLPGGNLAEYARDGQTYQQFLMETQSGETAALLMFDYKNALADAKYLPHMGGYFGSDGGQPVYVFAKEKWVAGIVGLPQEEADLVAREFAARLN